MVKAKTPKSQRRSRGGRPRKEGDRYPGGQLKPAGPNERSLEIRKGLGLGKLNQRMVPLDVAHANGWLSDVDYLTGIRFANLHQAAGFNRAGSAMGSTLEVDMPTEVSLSVSLHAKSFFAGLPHNELAALWDRVFDRGERDANQANEGAAKAMKLWKSANAAMTAEERDEVTNVCVLDSWPQWIIQRSAGREGTTWEKKRDALIRGLAKVRAAIRPERTVDPVEDEPLQDGPTGPLRTEHFVYVDETGAQVLEVERITRRPEAA